jgi:hypothetical protein
LPRACPPNGDQADINKELFYGDWHGTEVPSGSVEPKYFWPLIKLADNVYQIGTMIHDRETSCERSTELGPTDRDGKHILSLGSHQKYRNCITNSQFVAKSPHPL